MQRLHITPRPDWHDKFDAMGFTFHSVDGCYWDESVCYRFSEAEIDVLDDTTAELHSLCLQAVDMVIAQQRYAELDIPAAFVPLIEASWKTQASSLYGRFDLAYDGAGAPKLLEYNADTPTAVFEAAVAQWHWLEETGRPDQFNSLHEKLIAQWQTIAGRLPIGTPVYFSCVQDNSEDYVCTEYLRDTAMQAGLDTEFCYVDDLGWDGKRFVDLQDRPIQAWFKLYPWEWLMQEEFGRHLLNADLHIFEPAWKTILSNKGILPILWELFPGHPNLLPAFRQPESLGGRYAVKPLHSREGANVTLVDGGRQTATGGPYSGKVIYQQLTELPNFDGNYPVLGSWIVGNNPAGIGIREDRSPITSNASRFVPHFFEP